MAFRRPTPEGFDEDLDLLVELERRRDELQREIDDVILRLTVEKRGPTMTIAERLNVTHPAVSSRRNGALKRRKQRLEGREQRLELEAA
jgi:hypothetical protein